MNVSLKNVQMTVGIILMRPARDFHDSLYIRGQVSAIRLLLDREGSKSIKAYLDSAYERADEQVKGFLSDFEGCLDA